MKKEQNSRDFPIWVIGDSPPRNFADRLEYPLDKKHPARHNIWTSVVDEIQENLYRADQRRFLSGQVYFRNAVSDLNLKPKATTTNWQYGVNRELNQFTGLVKESHPIAVFSLGAFSFEFCGRALGNTPTPFRNWGARRLGDAFRLAVENFDFASVNLIPLLHVSISRGRFLEAHDYFCGSGGGNYFEYVGREICALLTSHLSRADIWMK